ncbi:MAG: hypothetical protein ACI9JM_000391 [Halioglobus sp.]|jgi:hypothetical protein
MGSSRTEFSFTRTVITALALLLGISACSDNKDSTTASKPQPDNPVVTGPISGGGAADCCMLNFSGFIVDLRMVGYTPGTPFYAGLSYDEAEVGYLETEYFLSGTAKSYIGTDEFGSDGKWPVQAADTADYITRIVVQRPIDPAAFNGVAVVEWFNVSGGVDSPPAWLQAHTELVREGYVWVGVSAQRAGVEGGGAFDLPVKTIDPERYGELNHPGDSFSYDIFSQAAQAVRNPQGMDPLGGLNVTTMIATGQSQSASRLITYINAVHPTIELFDGFIVHGRGSGSSSLSQEPQLSVATPRPAYIRGDMPQPVITLQAETDVLRGGAVTFRQDDSDVFRLWEVAGSAHTDLYTTIRSQEDRGDDPTIADVLSKNDARPPFITCAIPVNDGPAHWVTAAAISQLKTWIHSNSPAPAADRLALTADGSAYDLDAYGNVKGGVRTPYVDAPVATLSGLGQPPADAFCGLLGTTALFDAATLATLYPTNADYINDIDTATDAAVEQGFLRPADGDLIKARARTSGIGGL